MSLFHTFYYCCPRSRHRSTDLSLSGEPLAPAVPPNWLPQGLLGYSTYCVLYLPVYCLVMKISYVIQFRFSKDYEY